jgi:heme oxygenase (biliverdin-IX-beta and delta-forming)
MEEVKPYLEAPASPRELTLKVSPLELIRQRTRGLHAQVESFLDLNAALASVKGYSLLLYRYLAVYRPFEESLRICLGDSLGIASWSYHSKVSLLSQDLQVLNAVEALTRTSPSLVLPNMDSLDATLGALYVTEGSSLGGQVIFREVQHRLNLDRESGAAFFFGDGSQTGTQWRNFTVMLNQHVSEPETAAKAACTMFKTFEQALRPGPEATAREC